MSERHSTAGTTTDKIGRSRGWLNRRRAYQGWRGQRGAVIAEAAIVLPVVLTLILGVMEFGFIWKDDLTIANGTRSAVRIGAADGKAQYADYDILQQIKSATTALPANVIQQVVVWEANSQTSVPSNCVAPAIATNGGVTGLCNTYTGTDVTTLTQASFTNSCTTGPDHFWCPSSRLNTQAGPPDYVGVYIRINHAYVTKILGSSRTLADSSIMRIEPLG